MKFNTENLAATTWQYLTKSIVGLLMLAMVWHGVILGVDAATISSPLLATSADSISKQVTGKAEEMKGAATKAIGKAQSAMEDKAGAAKMKVKDDLTETKIAVDANAARVENTAEKATEKVKNFFGK